MFEDEMFLAKMRQTPSKTNSHLLLSRSQASKFLGQIVARRAKLMGPRLQLAILLLAQLGLAPASWAPGWPEPRPSLSFVAPTSVQADQWQLIGGAETRQHYELLEAGAQAKSVEIAPTTTTTTTSTSTTAAPSLGLQSVGAHHEAPGDKLVAGLASSLLKTLETQLQQQILQQLQTTGRPKRKQQQQQQLLAVGQNAINGNIEYDPQQNSINGNIELPNFLNLSQILSPSSSSPTSALVSKALKAIPIKWSTVCWKLLNLLAWKKVLKTHHPKSGEIYIEQQQQQRQPAQKFRAKPIKSSLSDQFDVHTNHRQQFSAWPMEQLTAAGSHLHEQQLLPADYAAAAAAAAAATAALQSHFQSAETRDGPAPTSSVEGQSAALSVAPEQRHRKRDDELEAAERVGREKVGLGSAAARAADWRASNFFERHNFELQQASGANMHDSLAPFGANNHHSQRQLGYSPGHQLVDWDTSAQQVATEFDDYTK